MTMYHMQFLLQASTFSNANAQLMPLVFVAMMLDAIVVVVWYYLGVLLNNSAVKQSALGEFYQFIGTVIMVGIIIGSLYMLSTVFYSSLGATSLMKPSAISQLCNNIMSTSQLDVLGKSNSLLSGPASTTAKYIGLCSLVKPNGNPSITQRLDYPLAATGVIIANLTNQTAANLNYSFTIGAFLGFLSELTPSIEICTPPCLYPNPEVQPLLNVSASFIPYKGYSLLTGSFTAINGLLTWSTEAFIAQILLLSIFMYIWPWLLFGGFVLRSTLFTRRLGGLLIAVAIVGLLVFPTVFAFEYLAMANGISVGTGTGNPNGLNTTYGFNAITSIPATPHGTWPKVGVSTGNYVTNFFVEPNLKAVAFANDCWPNVGGYPTSLIKAEGDDILNLLIPFASVFSSIKYLFDMFALGSSSPTFPLLNYCKPANALSTFYGMLNAFGPMGITSFFIPLVNLALGITAITGLSPLFGGDTSLARLSKLV